MLPARDDDDDKFHIKSVLVMHIFLFRSSSLNPDLLNRNTNNKLFQVKPFLGEWRPAFRKLRKEQVTITRLRIGHCRLTHSFILKQEHQPQCSTYQTPCTIKHVLLECKVFNDTRKHYFHANTMKDLFEKSTWIMFCRS